MLTDNIWNIQEYTGDGISCPITPVNLPWYKKTALFFFRFGVCPLCVTSSVVYSLVRAVRGQPRQLAPGPLVGTPEPQAA